jgi:lysine 6-dehydrogenase
MPFSYVVLGAGRQGLALAYDLAKNCDAALVRVADLNSEQLDHAQARLRTLLPNTACQLQLRICDVSKPAEVAQTIAGADVVLSAAPYRFNAELTEAAIAAGASFCDLGGNTAVVRQELAQHDAAQRSGVSVVPDCGLAPGLGNILAAHGLQQMDTPRDVHVRCGGLPEHPVGALGYKLVFNFDGLINEYSGSGEFLRGGQRVQVPALTELESIEFAPPLGKCEAAVTSGGTSTCPDSFAGRLRTYDYKTVRYPGHFAIVRAMFELGLFEPQVVLHDGRSLAPKPLIRQLMEDRLRFPEIRDLVVLRCTISGTHHGAPRTIQYDLFDRHDEQTGFTAMERTTAFPTTLVAYMQGRRLIAPGARPLELCLPTAQYMAELAQHDIRVAVQDLPA